jgi:hypothetical protein
VWEEGTWSGSRVTRLSVLLVFTLVALDLAVTRHLGPVFDVGFILLCGAMAMAVRQRDFFRVGVLPPLILFGLCLLLAVVWRSAIAQSGDSLIQAVISGLAHRSGALFIGYAVTLLLLAVRHRVLSRRAAAGPGHSNLAASPAPYLATSGAPEEKSTTVVGEEPHSPESRTASNI